MSVNVEFTVDELVQLDYLIGSLIGIDAANLDGLYVKISSVTRDTLGFCPTTVCHNFNSHDQDIIFDSQKLVEYLGAVKEKRRSKLDELMAQRDALQKQIDQLGGF
jgi:hypothetical protein